MTRFWLRRSATPLSQNWTSGGQVDPYLVSMECHVHPLAGTPKGRKPDAKIKILVEDLGSNRRAECPSGQSSPLPNNPTPAKTNQRTQSSVQQSSVQQKPGLRQPDGSSYTTLQAHNFATRAETPGPQKQ